MSKLAAASPDLPRVGVLIVQAFAPLRCAVFQVVKTAQSRGRTERTPALRRRPRGARGMLRTGLIRHFRCHITVCYTQLITPTSADDLPVAGGTCTGGAHRCKAKQGLS